MSVGSDYRVNLKKNELYNVNFYAKFLGLSPEESTIKADYAIEVKVRGFQIEENEKIIRKILSHTQSS